MNHIETNRETYNSISNKWDEKRKYIWQAVKDFFESQDNIENIKLLDLGCGTGRFLELAQNLGYKNENMIGSDFSEGQLELVKKKGFQTKKSELTKTSFEDKEFDNIICIAAHHHLLEKNDQLKSLIEMKKILNDNGSLFLSNWFPTEDFIKKNCDKGKFEFLDKKKQKVRVYFYDGNNKYERYYYFFKEKELIELCKEAGFKINKKEYNEGNLYLTLIKN